MRCLVEGDGGKVRTKVRVALAARDVGFESLRRSINR
jgi:hypothetical protein